MAQIKKQMDGGLQLPMLLESNGNVGAGTLAAPQASHDSDPVLVSDTVVPFVKWVGGKRSIVEHLKRRFPTSIREYYEPFVGGGALFFEMQKRASRSHLSDSNLELMLTYRVVQKDPQALLTRLRKHAKAHYDEYYYKVRSLHALQDPVEIAARFIYLNRTCYNGLYRVNKKGEFNVPVGDYANPGIVQESNILACSRALQANVTLAYRDFISIEPSRDDFVYFDPPYHPTDETSFTAYSKADFTEKDQVRLAEFAKNLHEAGVKVMLSNSNTRFIRDLYRSSIFRVELVNAPRMVNCKPNGRSAVEEVLITNY
jgi:DNA adenine methylase